jgi:hypothetical protein
MSHSGKNSSLLAPPGIEQRKVNTPLKPNAGLNGAPRGCREGRGRFYFNRRATNVGHPSHLKEPEVLDRFLESGPFQKRERTGHPAVCAALVPARTATKVDPMIGVRGLTTSYWLVASSQD